MPTQTPNKDVESDNLQSPFEGRAHAQYVYSAMGGVTPCRIELNGRLTYRYSAK